MKLIEAYNTLGLNRNVEFNEVRAKYFYLAKKHHPDKYVPPEDLASERVATNKLENEEYFKNITVAYHIIEKNKDGSNIFNSEEYNNEELKNIWKKVEIFFSKPETWEFMADFVEKVATVARPPSVPPVPPKKHYIKLKLTLEEIHNKKIKKLRLFLKGIIKPVFLSINSADILKNNIIEFNNYKIDNNYIDITIDLKIQKDSKFKLLRLLDRFDIFYYVRINWYDYINGKTIYINYFDGRKIEVNIPSYYDIELPIVRDNEGLCNQGDLFITIKIENPKDKKEFKEIYAKLRNLVIHPRVSRAKTI